MHVLIAGGTGFIGQALCEHLIDQNHQVTVLSRSPDRKNAPFHLQYTLKNINQQKSNKVRYLAWEDFALKAQDITSGTHWLINLAGANIGKKRWSSVRKQSILESRIKTTEYLAKICASLGKQSPVFFSASAVGVYGHHPGEKNCDESMPIDFYQHDCFLSEVGRQWELATAEAEKAGVRTVKLRLGVVLGHGGVLSKLKPLYQLGLGGRIGRGQQMFPWISMEDLIRAMDFIFETPSLSGPINLTTPTSITQEVFAKALGKALNRPTFLTTPAWVLKSIYGQMAEELLLQGQSVTPTRLLEAGFSFSKPQIEQALASLFTQQKVQHHE